MDNTNQQETTLNESQEFEEKLGIKREKCIEHIRLIKFMAWEQVLLVAQYARYQYFQREHNASSHFHSRLQFLKIALKQDKILPLACQLLDEGMSFLTITNKMREHGDTLKFQVDCLLSECERQQIAFANLHQPLLYPHYSLLIALERIVDVFQRLLCAPAPEMFCDQIALKVIRSRRPFQFNHPLNAGKPNSTETLASLLSALEPDKGIGVEIEKEIDNHLARWMTNAFNLFANPTKTHNEDDYKGDSKRQKVCSTSQNIRNNELTLTFDRDYLVRCMTLGQADQVMNTIRNELQSYIGEVVIRGAKPAKATAPSTLSAWYRECSVLDIRWEISIPPKAAMLIDLDVRHSHIGIGFFNYSFQGVFENSLTKAESAVLTTAIIEHCLYRQGDLDDFRKPFGLSTRCKQVDEFIPKTEAEASKAEDSMMESWSGKEESKIKERFKRPRRQIEGDILEVEKKIREQMSSALKTSYPIDGPFPLPLWHSGHSVDRQD